MTDPNRGAKSDYRQLMKDALLELDSLQSQLESLRRLQFEPIAIVGMACRFPAGANGPGPFWDLLRSGADLVREVPPERWRLGDYYDGDEDRPGKVYSRHAALIEQGLVEGFDHAFFGIAPREAERMDPQQRMLLEVCWEALEDAGAPPDPAAGARTGLFVGSCTDDFLHLTNNLVDLPAIDAYSSLGTARCITVGRVSYLLGLEGPAVQLDTACSSSLVAVHQACQSLRARECDMALAGGVNLQLSPVWTVGLCKLRALSPDGRCKTFDAAANGFVRGEGCGIVALKRLSDAVADGDRVLALLRGSAVNHDGRSGGLTVPNQSAQERLLREALAAARIQPGDVDYVEAHGTGTSLGDPIEMGALASVFGRRDRPLRVGSVKANAGHLEAAAGIVGLLKVVLSLQHEAIPPQLHFQQPNPHIPWDQITAEVPIGPVPWPRGSRRRLAGVSSFGFSGTNAHVVVEEAPLSAAPAAAEQRSQLLVLSAKTPQALRDLGRRYRDFLSLDESARWEDVCYTAWMGRAHFEHRLAVVANTSQDARQLLDCFLRDQPCNGVYQSPTPAAMQAADGESPLEGASGWNLSAAEGREREALLGKLAELYVSGLRLPWRELNSAASGKKVTLPLYPFQRKRFRLPRPGNAGLRRSDAAPPRHPLLGRRVYSAATSAGVQFESELSAAQPSFLADHRLEQTAVMPATAELEMALAAAQRAMPESDVRLEDVVFHRVMALPEGDSRIVQTVVTPQPSGHHVEIFSRPRPPSDDVDAQWTRHVTGRASSVEPPSSLQYVSLEAVRESCPEPLSADAVRERIRLQGIVYGAAYGALRHVWRGRRQALGYVEAAQNESHEGDPYWLHPGMYDACLQVIAGLTEVETETLLLPASLQRLEVFGRPGRSLWSHVRLCSREDDARRAGCTCDVDLLAPDGRLLARLNGLEMRSADPLSLAIGLEDASADWLYCREWRAGGLASGVADGGETGVWLLLADQEGVAEMTAQQLAAAGHRCLLVWPGDQFEKVPLALGGIAAYRIRAGDAADFQRMISTALSSDGGAASAQLRGVVNLWGMSLPQDAQNAFADSHRLACRSVQHLIQALSLAKVSARLWLVTRGGQCLGEATDRGASLLAQAPLWGLGQVVSLEHPELRCACLDLDPQGELAAQADALFLELSRPDDEDQVAYRHGVRRVARLAVLDHPPAGGTIVRREGSYLITGGLGALGLAVADWLFRQGARTLVLSSRREATSNEQRAAIRQLQQAGASVHVLPADVSSRADVERLLSAIRATLPPLRGVAHLAGIADDGLLRNQDWVRLERVMRPKVAGAWSLHELVGQVDFFILFSSAVGLLGAPGQGGYAAANAFLDALAQHRRELGLPATSIAWGPWEVGMTARINDRSQRHIRQMGLRTIRLKTGLEMLARAVSQPQPAVAALHMDWARLADQAAVRPLWAGLVQGSAPFRQRTSPLVARLRAAPQDNRMGLLIDHIRQEVMGLFGWESAEQVGPRRDLFELGMDSITSVELQRRLEKTLACLLPSTVAYDYPHVEALAQYLAVQLNLLPASTRPSDTRQPSDRDRAERVAAMSDEEIETLLAEKLKDLL